MLKLHESILKKLTATHVNIDMLFNELIKKFRASSIDGKEQLASLFTLNEYRPPNQIITLTTAFIALQEIPGKHTSAARKAIMPALLSNALESTPSWQSLPDATKKAVLADNMELLHVFIRNACETVKTEEKTRSITDIEQNLKSLNNNFSTVSGVEWERRPSYSSRLTQHSPSIRTNKNENIRMALQGICYLGLGLEQGGWHEDENFLYADGAVVIDYLKENGLGIKGINETVGRII